MSVGALPCQAIAASVTAYGRQMIEAAKDSRSPVFSCSESHFKAQGQSLQAHHETKAP